MTGRIARPYAPLILTFCFLLTGSAIAAQTRPSICANSALKEAVKIILEACSQYECNPLILRKLDTNLDKASVLVALRSLELSPVHIFFPRSVSSIDESFDWETSKKNHLRTLRGLNLPAASVFVIGQASSLGSSDYNWHLSRARMQSVLDYISDEVMPGCGAYHHAFLGEDIFQLSLSDASFIGLQPEDYRGDEYILNQSVHVFVYPCPVD